MLTFRALALRQSDGIVLNYVNCLFSLACVELRTTINKLYFVPEWAVSGVVGLL